MRRLVTTVPLLSSVNPGTGLVAGDAAAVLSKGTAAAVAGGVTTSPPGRRRGWTESACATRTGFTSTGRGPNGSPAGIRPASPESTGGRINPAADTSPEDGARGTAPKKGSPVWTASWVPSAGTVPKFTAWARSAAFSPLSRDNSGAIAPAIAGTINWRATPFAPDTSPFIAMMNARARHAA